MDVMIYGLIGEKLKHSYSKEIHQNFSKCQYDLWSLDEINFDLFLKNKKFKGINVTIPYKEKCLKYLDSIDKEAQAIGAVNTIINENGVLKGYNTDILGFKYLLHFYHISLKEKRIAILGTGGTAKMIQYVACKEKCKSCIFVSRNEKKGAISYLNLKKEKNIDIIINATPNGMYGFDDESLVDLNDFIQLEGIIDVIYNPLRTSILIKAQEKKIKIASGLIMLVAQAFFAHELFLQKKLDSNMIIKEYQRLYLSTLNLVLIGMPGSGKTTIGNLLAKKWNKECISFDDEIKNQEKLEIKDIFAMYGEEYFRNLETKMCEKYSLVNNKILSTGGGVVLNDKNIQFLKKNGLLIFIDRGINKITLDDSRPLTKNYQEWKHLYQTRIELYNKHCDIKVDNNLSLEKTINKIEELIYESIGFKWS